MIDWGSVHLLMRTWVFLLWALRVQESFQLEVDSICLLSVSHVDQLRIPDLIPSFFLRLIVEVRMLLDLLSLVPDSMRMREVRIN
jgi:hypothetical protein